VEDGSAIHTLDLTTRLNGAELAVAANRLKLPDKQLAAIRAGATELEVPLPILGIAMSADNTHLAATLPFGVVELIDLNTGSVRELRPVEGSATLTQVRFSPHGGLLAMVAQGESRVLLVYDTTSAEPVARIGLGDQVDPALVALESGVGFATIGNGHVLVHPVFEKAEDLIAYLAREFPDPLSPQQRRFFFIQ